MLLMLLVSICSILVPTMAAYNSLPMISNYSADCPRIQLQQTFDIQEMEGLWFEYENNPDVVGYTCASYMHHVITDNRLQTNFSCIKTNEDGFQNFPVEWAMFNSTHPNASGISCFVYTGPIIQGSYYFIEINPELYIGYTCNHQLEETLHIVARKNGYSKESAYEKIKAAGVGHLIPRMVDSYNNKTCPID